MGARVHRAVPISFFLLCILGFSALFLLNPSPAYSYKMDTHSLIAETAWELLADMPGGSKITDTLAASDGDCAELRKMPVYKPIPRHSLALDGLPVGGMIATEVGLVDRYYDMGFIRIRNDRIDPFADGSEPVHELLYEFEENYTTSFNHFIDIKKYHRTAEPGIYNDYDGYSYIRGSASQDQFQDASEVFPWMDQLDVPRPEMLDNAIYWFFHEAYVFCRLPGEWMDGPSPAVFRYSGKIGETTGWDEIASRFPMQSTAYANSDTGALGDSVFMPVDNLAMYWFNQWEESNDPLTLAPVLHAVMDATIPHHSASIQGNWHGDYEKELKGRMPVWISDGRFNDEAISLFRKWNRIDPDPPDSLWYPDDMEKIPAVNWSVDMLVTWCALNAYHEYDTTYDHFRDGYRFDRTSARELAVKATAMSMLILTKASGKGEMPIGGGCACCG